MEQIGGILKNKMIRIKARRRVSNNKFSFMSWIRRAKTSIESHLFLENCPLIALLQTFKWLLLAPYFIQILIKIIKFLRYYIKMALRRGLRYGDDDDQPKQYEKQSLQANRDRSNFEKDMDSLLFGGGPAPPRRRRNQGQETKKQEPKKQEPKKQPEQKTTPPPPPPPPKKVQPTPQPPPRSQIDSKGTLPISTTKLIDKKPEPKQNLNKSKDSNRGNTSINSQTSQPKKQIDNYVQKKSDVDDSFHQPSSIIIEQPKKERQIDTIEATYGGVSNLRHNRPAYIRKLKKVAEDFNFAAENSQNHVAHEVVRPIECVREPVMKSNVSGFQDLQFPPDSYSIGPKYRPELVMWRKPNQVYRTPVFGKYVEPNDIEPGSLSSPQFLSTLSCLAEREQNIKRLIENQKVNSNGFYYVRLNINGVWRYIAVDDNLPELDDAPIGARSFNDSEAELWPSIIEKAYAKAYQGYISFGQNTPREHYLRDLTGSPVKKYNARDSNLSWVIGDALEKGWPVIAVPKEKIIDIGFNPNYSLSVLRCNSKGALELRSSWGTVSERPKVSISKEGVFELSSTQSPDYISHILIAETDSNMKTTTIQSKHYGSFYSCFNFRVSNTTYGTISVNQLDRRMFSINCDYDYVPFRVILEMKNASDQGQSLYINAAFSHHSRNLDLPVNLAPGSYYIYCIGQWPHQPYDFDVTIFANQIVPIKKVYYENFPNIISECLTQVNLSNGKRASKGHVDEYLLYHEPSNLVLVTAKSLIDKPYQFTLNLNQVKFDNLTLLNAAFPEEDYSKKNRYELEDLKNSCFSSKTWNVNLLPEEKYTWVFSSNSDYDPENCKRWGFK